MTKLLGSENASNIPLQDIGDEFKSANLPSKLASMAQTNYQLRLLMTPLNSN
ncbi:MAG: hypothetical protein GX799_03880 [Crenarchaeota archaeon]|nr:hypothetical protein [Thermoproteota archaeon]